MIVIRRMLTIRTRRVSRIRKKTVAVYEHGHAINRRSLTSKLIVRMRSSRLRYVRSNQGGKLSSNSEIEALSSAKIEDEQP